MLTVIVAANVGADVIVDWSVEIGTVDGDGKHRWHQAINSALRGSLPPGRLIEATLELRGARSCGVPAVTFTDSLGYRWRRQGDDVRPASEAADMRTLSERAAMEE